MSAGARFGLRRQPQRAGKTIPPLVAGLPPSGAGRISVRSSALRPGGEKQRSRMGRAQRNPSLIPAMAIDGFRCALPILRASAACAASTPPSPICTAARPRACCWCFPHTSSVRSPHERSDMRELSRPSGSGPGYRSAHPGYKVPGIRSPFLTLFWHCGRPQNSSRTGPERTPGNEPSMVLAEI